MSSLARTITRRSRTRSEGIPPTVTHNNEKDVLNSHVAYGSGNRDGANKGPIGAGGRGGGGAGAASDVEFYGTYFRKAPMERGAYDSDNDGALDRARSNGSRLPASPVAALKRLSTAARKKRVLSGGDMLAIGKASLKMTSPFSFALDNSYSSKTYSEGSKSRQTELSPPEFDGSAR